MNTIHVNFFPCTPAPANGYNVLWRVAGSSDPYTDAGHFTVSPAIFSDGTHPNGTEYEGIIRSDCGSGIGFGDPVAWSTVTQSQTFNYTLSAAYNFSIDSVSWAGSPSLPPTGVNGQKKGHHTALSGICTVTISGSLVFASKLDLLRNGLVIDCLPISGPGLYNFGTQAAAEGDTIQIAIDLGVC